jgi:hypothetical protein
MFPLTGLRLLLPAIVPSWRFFDAVTASPRVDYVVLEPFEPGPDEGDPTWREFRPRPEVVTPATMLRRLLWNPQWNESLFLVSLAERLIHAATAQTALHSQRELLLRVARDLHRRGWPRRMPFCRSACVWWGVRGADGQRRGLSLRPLRDGGPDHAMTLESALRLSDAMMALAFIQQSLEHLRPATRLRERLLFAPRLILSLLLLADSAGWALPGLHAPVLLAALVVNHLAILPFLTAPTMAGPIA